MHFLGVDIGSLSCDAVVIDDSERMVAWSVVPTGARNMAAIERAKEEVLRKAGLEPEEVKATIATGYGRNRVEGRLAAVTEITCHARGIRACLPQTNVLVDIGGQDSKSILLGDDGRVLRFAMNDKCAAGTGRFLEAMARALEVDIEQLAVMDVGATSGMKLSSMCTVFAESEVVSLIAEGAEVNEIVRALNLAIASRTRTLVKRVARDIEGLRVAMSGGVARNAGVVRALGDELRCSITVPPEPDTIGAYGAALIARDRWLRAA
ncbi:MAG: 2-hydroxyglutaryl-CoA dehydratase [Deltaproteobacteria bacterium]|nr:2-hydroxyglutaryl-CoA dehydratase [Deltaproteobacteria bacterium]